MGLSSDDIIASWLTCYFCGAAMPARHARHLPVPFAGALLPACPDCVETRERVSQVARASVAIQGATTTEEKR